MAVEGKKNSARGSDAVLPSKQAYDCGKDPLSGYDSADAAAKAADEPTAHVFGNSFSHRI